MPENEAKRRAAERFDELARRTSEGAPELMRRLEEYDRTGHDKDREQDKETFRKYFEEIVYEHSGLMRALEEYDRTGDGKGDTDEH